MTSDKMDTMPDKVFLDWLGNWYSTDISPEADEMFQRQRFTRTDWLRSQIEGMRKPLLPPGNCDANLEIKKRNATLDQILTLLLLGDQS